MRLQQLIADVMREPPSLFSSGGSEYREAGTSYTRIRNSLASAHHNDKPVGIILPKNPDYFLCILACMELGIPYVPLKEDFPEKRIREISEEADIGLFIDQDFLDTLPEQAPPLPVDYRREYSDDMPLYIIFTSGSSGRPKGVVISRGAFAAYLNWLELYLPSINEHDRLLQVTEFTFDISLIDLVLYLTKKTPLYFTDFGGAIFKMAQEIAKYQITAVSTVPNNINMLLSKFIVTKADFSSLHSVMIGGARMSYGLYQKLCVHFDSKSVSNFYGPTEFTIYSHAKKLTFSENSDCDNANVSIGQPNAEVMAEIYCNGQFCDHGEPGELLLSGTQIMSEYINNPEKTTEVIIEVKGVPYYKTGDLAYKNDKNDFFITGRMDDTVKYRGYRINLLDIDSYIAKLHYIQDVTTIAVADEMKENITVSFIIVREGDEDKISTTKVKSDLKDILIDYQIPEKIRFVSSFPVNVSGKVCKKQLLSLYKK
ncbi:MAG: D-alanine--poly(phosphoribitol) ligase subunit 1 [Flavobacteriales bacterium]|jgi:D-alanine--poly(phosphoribitol) ligase subunit 1